MSLPPKPAASRPAMSAKSDPKKAEETKFMLQELSTLRKEGTEMRSQLKALADSISSLKAIVELQTDTITRLSQNAVMKGGVMMESMEDDDDEAEVFDEPDSDLETLDWKSDKREPPNEDMFGVDEAGGEEFMAVKPWLGAIHAPPGYKEQRNANAVPVNELQLEFVHGYRGHDCRDNLFYLSSGEIVFSAAGVGVVYNKSTHSQRFFFEHTDDILAISLHPNGKYVCSGEIGKNAVVCVWETEEMKCLAKLSGFHKRGVPAVSFSSDGSKVVSVGLDDDHSVAVWDWQKGVKLADSKGDKNKILCVAWNPYDDNFVTVGIKHVKFWTLSGKSLKAGKGVFGKKGAVQTILCIEFTAPMTTITGTSDGHIYMWKGNQLASKVEVHQGPVFDLWADDDGHVASGGKDGRIVLLDRNLKILKTVELAQAIAGTGGYSDGGPVVCIRSLCWVGGRLLLGTKNNEVYEVDEKTGKGVLLLQGHARNAGGNDDGEVWGLATHPSENICATAGDDCSLRIWDLNAKKQIHLFRTDTQLRSCCYSPDGRFIACGTLTGGFHVFDLETNTEKVKLKHRKQSIGDIKYSPDGHYLAIGSHDNFIDLYDVTRDYKRVGYCRGHSSYITHFDWSADSCNLQSNCGAYELLFWSAPDCGQVTKSSSLAGAEWASWTCVLGWPVQGIYPKFSDGTDVNACHRSHSGDVIATGDDFGKVNLFKYPVANKDAACKSYTGHSSHVTNCRFTYNDAWLSTTGGGDLCLFQWRHKGPGVAEIGDDTAVLDPAVGTGDSDIDCLVNQKSLHKDVSAADGGAGDDMFGVEEASGEEFMAVKPWLGAIHAPPGYVPAKNADDVPESELELEFVHGYRGHDCRDNLFYLRPGGDEIVYHAAGLGIVYNAATHTQRFFTGHTDDIISLALHPSRKLAATGEIGKQALICVWETDTMSCVSVLKGFHKRGVPSVGFSRDGSRLVSVGDDDDHSVAVWDWKKGIKLADSTGDKNKILTLACSPFEDMFVTVGIKHIKFWPIASKLKASKGVYGKLGGPQPILAVEFVGAGTTITGTADGNIYVWKGSQLSKKIAAHAGPVFDLWADDTGVASGGKDGKVVLFDTSLKPSRTIELEKLTAGLTGPSSGHVVCIRALCWEGGKLLLGTANDEIYELDDKGTRCRLLVQGHSSGEVWGLATHPTRAQYVTACDDKTVRIWDVPSRRVLQLVHIDDKARSVAWSPDGAHIAVGLMSGAFVVLDGSTLHEVLRVKQRNQEIGDIRYSPSGEFLAVASHDNFIDIYEVHKGYKRTKFCKGHSSYITHIDFSADSCNLQSNCGAYELLFWSVPDCTRIPKSSSLAATEWATWTCVLGWPVQGIYPKFSDGTDVNSADRSHNHAVIATGDDFGKVNLYRYPCANANPASKVYPGHSSHVTNVRFTVDDAHLLSTGGGDLCVFQWKHTGPGIEEMDDSNEGTAFADGDAGGGEEEGDPNDSDVEQLVAQKSNKVDDDDMFGVEESGGEEFMAVKPWVGAIHPPSSWTSAQENKSAPEDELVLEHVHGYRGFDSRDNLFYTANGDVVYPAAGVGVVLNIATNKQKFFVQHSDDIVSMGLHPNGSVVCTGEIGKAAVVYVWDSLTLAPLACLSGFHKRGVPACGFNSTGQYVISVGDDDDHSVAVWDWEKGARVADAKGDRNKILAVAGNPYSEGFVTTGVKHIKFWTLSGNKLIGSKGSVGKVGQVQAILAIEFVGPEITLTGTNDGHIYLWKGSSLAKKLPAHEGPVFDLYADDNGVASGGKDGKVVLWDTKLKPMRTIELAALTKDMLTFSAGSNVCIRSLIWLKGRILIGTRDNEILEMDDQGQSCRLLVAGHADRSDKSGKHAEVWGLCAHPSLPQYITCSDDGSVRVWDSATRRAVAVARVGGPARCVAISPDGSHIAVGLLDGGLVVLDGSSLTPVCSQKPRKSEISDLKYSPDGQYLAAGSHDNYIDLFDVGNGYQKAKKPCRGHSSYITHLDWAADGSAIQSNCGAYELLFWSAPDCQQITKSSSLANSEWATWTCVLGWPVQGIYPSFSDGTDVNACDRAHSGTVVATSDDFGKVNLYRFPCTSKEAVAHVYPGHSSHVTCVRFSQDDRYLYSTGGMDMCVFQWRHIGPGLPDEPGADVAEEPLLARRGSVTLPPPTMHTEPAPAAAAPSAAAERRPSTGAAGVSARTARLGGEIDRAKSARAASGSTTKSGSGTTKPSAKSSTTRV